MACRPVGPVQDRNVSLGRFHVNTEREMIGEMSFILTLNMLNYFKNYKMIFYISYRILDIVQQNKTRFTMEQCS